MARQGKSVPCEAEGGWGWSVGSEAQLLASRAGSREAGEQRSGSGSFELFAQEGDLRDWKGLHSSPGWGPAPVYTEDPLRAFAEPQLQH